MDGHMRLDGECMLPRAERRERVLTVARYCKSTTACVNGRGSSHDTIPTTVLVLSIALPLAQRLTRALLPLGGTARERRLGGHAQHRVSLYS